MPRQARRTPERVSHQALRPELHRTPQRMIPAATSPESMWAWTLAWAPAQGSAWRCGLPPRPSCPFWAPLAVPLSSAPRRGGGQYGRCLATTVLREASPQYIKGRPGRCDGFFFTRWLCVLVIMQGWLDMSDESWPTALASVSAGAVLREHHRLMARKGLVLDRSELMVLLNEAQAMISSGCRSQP